jgi:hypothetical protein
LIFPSCWTVAGGYALSPRVADLRSGRCAQQSDLIPDAAALARCARLAIQSTNGKSSTDVVDASLARRLICVHEQAFR